MTFIRKPGFRQFGREFGGHFGSAFGTLFGGSAAAPAAPTITSIGAKAVGYPIAVATTTPAIVVSAPNASTVNIYVYDNTLTLVASVIGQAVSAGTASWTVPSGLSNVHAYTINVEAINSAGTSPLSGDYLFYVSVLDAAFTWLAKLNESSTGSVSVPRLDTFSTNAAPDATKVPSTSGLSGLAANFNGSTQLLDFPVTADNRIGAGDWCYMLLAHHGSVPGGNLFMFGEAVSTALTTGSFVIYAQANPRVSASVRDNAGNNSLLANTTNFGFANGDTNLYFIDFVASTKVATLYKVLSGSEKTVSATLANPANDTGLDLLIGGGGSFFAGWIEQVGRINRQLTPTERQTIYAALHAGSSWPYSF